MITSTTTNYMGIQQLITYAKLTYFARGTEYNKIILL